MIHLNQSTLATVQSKFSSTEVVKSIHLNVVSLNEDGWIGENRILALVAHENSYALFVLISSQAHPVTISDLTIECVIPIDNNFSCDVDSVVSQNKASTLNITSLKLKLQFNIEIGEESSKFASEVIRSRELSYSTSLNFQWLQKYMHMESVGIPDKTSATDVTAMNDQSPDLAVSRQRIAETGNALSHRESFLKYQLSLKEKEYINEKPFRVFCATWNVNGQPPTVSLKQWLSCDCEPPDIYAVGFQELDLSKEAFLFNDTPREVEWQKAVQLGLHSGAQYREVALVRLIGMQLIVLVNQKHYSDVKNVAVDTVGTGIMGKMGNKGGVVVRLELYNTSLCFVNSHLAAHVEEVERRNQDFNDINARVSFRKPPLSIKDHEQVYWLGDLNYRITDLSAVQVKKLIDSSDLLTILRADQLYKQKIALKVLQEYEEGDITFFPTYKFDLNSDTYDSSEKARAPAYTDRILWRGKGINQVAYRSHMELKISDHKPVSALFNSDISIIDPIRYRKVHEELLKKMDKLENEFLPQVTVDQIEITFDTVKFKEPQQRYLIIANTGQVPAEFEFIKKLNDISYCKEWLRISPYSGKIKPGEKCDVKLEVNLESELDELYDILVLHLEGGKDMFITVNGNCQKSCFTSSLRMLCRAPVPIMQLSSEQLNHCETEKAAILYSVPREVWLLIDHLYRYGLKQRDLFESQALHEDILRIRDWLDNGSFETIPGNVHVVAEALLLFLSYIKEPVIPYRLHQQCIASSSNFVACKQVIMQHLSELERNTFLYLLMFLQELINHSDENGTDSNTLASIFGDVLLRDPIRNSKPQATRGKTAFVNQFLVNDLSTLLAPPNK